MEKASSIIHNKLQNKLQLCVFKKCITKYTTENTYNRPIVFHAYSYVVKSIYIICGEIAHSEPTRRL